MAGFRPGVARHQRPLAERSGGAEGNERLTAMTGAVLPILLLIECYTIPKIGNLITPHVFLGMLLLGPVTLKAASVIYRFARYYTGSAPCRRTGPPALPLRLIGPVIVLLTACVFGSGARGVSASQGETVGRRGVRRAVEILGGRGTRLTLLLASLLCGLVIALLTVHLAGQWQGMLSGFSA